MRQAKIKMPIYTGDVSAVPAALYELGGMVIMHDASGCNSTYNSHDELRWYEKESLVFISGMTEIDAITGNDEKLISEITEAAMDLKPEFIAIASTPIPYIMGTDFKAITREIEKRTKLPCFFVPTNGTHSYIYGAGNAFLEYAKAVLKKEKNLKKCKKTKVNLLGVTPLDFSLTPIKASTEEWLQKNGMELGSCVAMDCSLEKIKETMEADVNLVVSSTGFLMAEYLEKEAGIPYVVGTPIGCFAETLADAVKNAKQTGESVIAYWTDSNIRSKIYIIGEPVISASLAADLKLFYGKEAKVLVPVECPEKLLRKEDQIIEGEEELEKELRKAEIVIADELLRPFCDENSRFYSLPHVACSGRIKAEQMPNLIKIR